MKISVEPLSLTGAARPPASRRTASGLPDRLVYRTMHLSIGGHDMKGFEIKRPTFEIGDAAACLGHGHNPNFPDRKPTARSANGLNRITHAGFSTSGPVHFCEASQIAPVAFAPIEKITKPRCSPAPRTRWT